MVLDEGGWLMPCLAALPTRNDLTPTAQEAGWTPGPIWTGVENLTPLVFDPLTVQPVVSCYADQVIPAHKLLIYAWHINNHQSLLK